MTRAYTVQLLQPTLSRTLAIVEKCRDDTSRYVTLNNALAHDCIPLVQYGSVLFTHANRGGYVRSHSHAMDETIADNRE